MVSLLATPMATNGTLPGQHSADALKYTLTYLHMLLRCLVLVIIQSYFIETTNLVLFIHYAVFTTSWLPSRRQWLLGCPLLLPSSTRRRKDGYPSPCGRRSKGEACKPAAEQHACCWGWWKLEYHAEYVCLENKKKKKGRGGLWKAMDNGVMMHCKAFANTLCFAGLYTDESPGLRVDPVVVLVLSLVFIFSVVALHGKAGPVLHPHGWRR